MFRLRKWYLDVIADDGRTFVGYWAALRWGLFSLRYHGSLYLNRERRVHAENRFCRATEPVLAGETLTWHAPGLRGCWQRRHPPIRERLLDGKDGLVDWHCLLPRAEVEVTHDRHGVLHGLGYAEYLEMTLPPWRLPIRQLHWGRYLSADDSLVWIRWVSATEPKTLVYHNGLRQPEAVVETAGIRLKGRTLRFFDTASLRTGSLGTTVLAKLRWLKPVIPSGVLGIDEQKWRSRGSFDGSGNTDGWAIHELVTWS